MQCDYCTNTEKELREYYELIDDEELTWYYLGPEGEITVCEMCHDIMH